MLSTGGGNRDPLDASKALTLLKDVFAWTPERVQEQINALQSATENHARAVQEASAAKDQAAAAQRDLNAAKEKHQADIERSKNELRETTEATLAMVAARVTAVTNRENAMTEREAALQKSTAAAAEDLARKNTEVESTKARFADREKQIENKARALATAADDHEKTFINREQAIVFRETQMAKDIEEINAMKQLWQKKMDKVRAIQLEE